MLSSAKARVLAFPSHPKTRHDPLPVIVRAASGMQYHRRISCQQCHQLSPRETVYSAMADSNVSFFMKGYVTLLNSIELIKVCEPVLQCAVKQLSENPKRCCSSTTRRAHEGTREITHPAWQFRRHFRQDGMTGIGHTSATAIRGSQL